MTSVRVGLLGLGTVGSQVAERLGREAFATERAGVAVELARGLVRDPNKPRAYAPPRELLTTDPEEILDDPTIAVIVEVMGGMEPARSHIEHAIESGK